MSKQAELILKRIRVFILIFTLMLTMMPLSPGSLVSAASTGTFRYGSVIKDAGGKPYNWKKSMTAPAYWWDASGKQIKDPAATYEDSTAGLERYTINTGGENRNGYCVAHGIKVDPQTTLTAKNIDSWVHTAAYPESSKKGIRYALIYGYQDGRTISDLAASGFRDSSFYHKHAESYTSGDWYIATQVLVWEYQQLIRTDSIAGGHGRKNNGLVDADHYYDILKGRAASDIYNYMASCMKNHREIPGFAEETTQKAEASKGWAMKENEDGSFSCTLTDRNSRFNQLIEAAGASKDKWTVTKEGQKYTFSYNGKLSKDGTVFKFAKKIPLQETFRGSDMVIWSWSSSGSLRQAVATGADKEPVTMFIKFYAGKPDVPEEPGDGKERHEPEFFPHVEFPIGKEDANPGWDGDSHTGMGDASLAAEYILERSIDGGPWEEADRITLDEFGTEEFLSDQPWTSADDLNMTESTPRHHEETDGSGNVTHSCNIEVTKAEWRSHVEYRIREIRVPDGRFTAPDSGIREGYTADYYAVTEDTRQCAKEPENWTDIAYTLKYSDPYGTDETVTGMLNDGSIELDAEFSFSPQTFINDCYRGKLFISKSNESEDVFNEEGSSGSQEKSRASRWKIRLDSGGWENHPYISFVEEGLTEEGTRKYRAVRDTSGTDNKVTDLTVGTNGCIFVYDLPYGNYIIDEVAADDTSFVLESFKQMIDEHDRRYDWNLRNKKKENVIKVVKVDAETGKPVQMTGTKFYIRYMGNPLLSDPSKSPNYGRLLPNASDINSSSKDYTFACNSNGEIVLPYDLEFGIYRIEEFLLPDGYFVGKYDENGNPADADFDEGDASPPEYKDLVAVYSKDGERVAYKAGDIFNYYTFNVDRQNSHMDGEDYEKFYKAVSMKNYPVKGKIEIKKEGEVLAGFDKVKKNGYTIWTPRYVFKKLAGAIFGIFAAVDEWRSDGSDGADLYDRATDKKLNILAEKTTHSGINGKDEIYEEGMLCHESGAKVYMKKHREGSAENRYTRVYTTPEQRPAAYGYQAERRENGMKILYDLNVEMKYNAGGSNYTEISLTKVTTAESGFAAEIPETEATASIGDKTYSPAVNVTTADGNIFDISKDVDVETGAECFVLDETSEDALKPQYDVPDGWMEMPYIPEIEENEGVITVKNPHYIMITRAADGESYYKILLADGVTWQECTADGRFHQSMAEKYVVKYTQQAGSSEGFSFELDGISVASKSEPSSNTAVTVIENPFAAEPEIILGIGYTQHTEGSTTTFTAAEPSAPVYFIGKDGMKTEMYLYGDMTKTLLTIPMSAVEANFDHVVPKIVFTRTGEIIDWYAKLSPDNPVFRREAAAGNMVTAVRCEGDKDSDVYYKVEILSNQTDGGETAGSEANGPFEITYADGYTARVYKARSEAGNDIGVMVMDGRYKTSTAALSDLVEMMTTDEEGKAVSSELPLGEYIVRELSAPDGWTCDTEKSWNTKLEYEDQYTPLVWDEHTFSNEYFKVEIDLSKVFETETGSGKYESGGGAIFGLYNAEPIFYGTEKLDADTLLDTFELDAGGRIISETKIPAGMYYLKELKTREGYFLNETPFYFAAGDSIKSKPLEISKDADGNDADGLMAKVVMDGTGKARITIETLTRKPAAQMTINGKLYTLDKEADEKYMKNSVQKDMARTIVLATESQPADITLANGKLLTVKVKGSTYSYSYDGREGQYVPMIVNTGYYADYTLDREPEDAEHPKDRALTLTSAGGASTLSLQTLQNLYAEVSLQKHDSENHSAEAVRVSPGETISLKAPDRALYMVKMKKDGSIKVSVSGVIDGELDEVNSPKLTVDGEAVTKDLSLTRSITMARQDSTAKTVQVKVNTLDNLNSGAIENDMEDQPNKPQPPEEPDKPKPEEPDKPELPEEPDEPEPEQPQTPEAPDKPQTPDKPDKPSKPQSAEKPDIPTTGDSDLFMLYFISMCISMAAITLLMAVETRKNKEKNIKQ